MNNTQLDAILAYLNEGDESLLEGLLGSSAEQKKSLKQIKSVIMSYLKKNFDFDFRISGRYEDIIKSYAFGIEIREKTSTKILVGRSKDAKQKINRILSYIDSNKSDIQKEINEKTGFRSEIKTYHNMETAIPTGGALGGALFGVGVAASQGVMDFSVKLK